jgi:hypothetical protein
MRLNLLAVALVLGMLAAPAHAAEPPTLAVDGLLCTQAGGPVPDGSYGLGVAVYDTAQGGTALFEETFLTVDVQGGLFALVLGDKKQKLDEPTLAGQRWVGVTVTGGVELPRVKLREVVAAVRARTATTALALQCSGCVGKDLLADGAVTAQKLADGSVQAQHVGFAYAASDEKGGVALSAKIADAAKVAETAKTAESAAKADEATVAKKAETLACTGCVSAAMLAGTVAADLVAQKQLAAIAVSGKYADLSGGPDLSGYGAPPSGTDATLAPSPRRRASSASACQRSAA